MKPLLALALVYLVASARAAPWSPYDGTPSTAAQCAINGLSGVVVATGAGATSATATMPGSYTEHVHPTATTVKYRTLTQQLTFTDGTTTELITVRAYAMSESTTDTRVTPLATTATDGVTPTMTFSAHYAGQTYWAQSITGVDGCDYTATDVGTAEGSTTYFEMTATGTCDADERDVAVTVDFGIAPLAIRGQTITTSMLPVLAQDWTVALTDTTAVTCVAAVGTTQTAGISTTAAGACSTSDLCTNDGAGAVCVINDPYDITGAITPTPSVAASTACVSTYVYAANNMRGQGSFGANSAFKLVVEIARQTGSNACAGGFDAEEGLFEVDISTVAYATTMRWGVSDGASGYVWAETATTAEGAIFDTVTINSVTGFFRMDAVSATTGWIDLTFSAADLQTIGVYNPQFGGQNVRIQGKMVSKDADGSTTGMGATAGAPCGATMVPMRLLFGAGLCEAPEDTLSQWQHLAGMPSAMVSTTADGLATTSGVSQTLEFLQDPTYSRAGTNEYELHRTVLVRMSACPLAPTERWGVASATVVGNPFGPTLNSETSICVNYPAVFQTAYSNSGGVWGNAGTGWVAAVVGDTTTKVGCAGGSGDTAITDGSLRKHFPNNLLSSGVCPKQKVTSTVLDEAAVPYEFVSTIQAWIQCNAATGWEGAIGDAVHASLTHDNWCRDATDASGSTGTAEIAPTDHPCDSYVITGATSFTRYVYTCAMYVTWQAENLMSEYAWDSIQLKNGFVVSATTYGTLTAATSDTEPFHVVSMQAQQIDADAGGLFAALTCSTAFGAGFDCGTGTPLKRVLEVTVTVRVDDPASGYYVMAPWWSAAEADYKPNGAQFDIEQKLVSGWTTAKGMAGDAATATNHPFNFPLLSSDAQTAYVAAGTKPITMIRRDESGSATYYRLVLYTTSLATQGYAQAFWDTDASTMGAGPTSCDGSTCDRPSAVYDYSFLFSPRFAPVSAWVDAGVTVGTWGTPATGVAEDDFEASDTPWPRLGANHKWLFNLEIKWTQEPEWSQDAAAMSLRTGIAMQPYWDIAEAAATNHANLDNLFLLPAADYLFKDATNEAAWADAQYGVGASPTASTTRWMFDDEGTSHTGVQAFGATDKFSLVAFLRGDDYVTNYLTATIKDVEVCQYNMGAHPAALACAMGTLHNTALDCADIMTIYTKTATQLEDANLHGSGTLESTGPLCNHDAWETFFTNTPETFAGAVNGWAETNPIATGGTVPLKHSTISSVTYTDDPTEGLTFCRYRRATALYGAIAWSGATGFSLANTECRWFGDLFAAYNRAWDAVAIDLADATTLFPASAGTLYTVQLVVTVTDANDQTTADPAPTRRMLRAADTVVMAEITGDAPLAHGARTLVEIPVSNVTAGVTVAYFGTSFSFVIGMDGESIVFVGWETVWNETSSSASSEGASPFSWEAFEWDSWVGVLAIVAAAVIVIALVAVVVFAVRRRQSSADGTGGPGGAFTGGLAGAVRKL